MIQAVKNNWRAVLGEFFGSAFISFWGLGLLIPFAWAGYLTNMYEFSVWFGIAFAFTVILFAPISGVHVNPGVTLAWAIFGKEAGAPFDKKLILPYWVAQILGWGFGLVPIFFAFKGYFPEVETVLSGEAANPAISFCCNLNEAGDFISGGVMEICLTAMLTLGIFMLLDTRLPGKPTQAGFPWAIGILIALTIALGGGFTGTCINPARDLGPRLAGLILGLVKGYPVSDIFGNGQWIFYIIAPMIGAVLGGVFHFKVFMKLLPKKEA